MDRSPSSTYSFGDFRLDADKRLLFTNDDEPVALMPKAFDTLRYLVEHAGEVVEKDELMSAVWPDTIVEENNLSQNISLLRKVLGERPGDHRYIVTVPGQGFKFVADVRIDAAPTSGDGRYARVVNDGRGSKVETKSGRIYVLQDWQRPGSMSESRGHKGSALPARQPSEEDPVTDGIENESVHLRKAEGESVASRNERDHAKAPVRRISLFWPGIALAVIAVSAAAVLIYRSNAPLNRELSISPLTSGADVAGAAISPDGRTFVYQTWDGEFTRMFLQRAGQLTAIEIVQPTKMVIGPTTFSPDGDYIYFSAREPDSPQFSVFRMLVLGGSSKKVVTGIFFHSAVSFSPDGSEFVFARYDEARNVGSIVIARRDGSEEREVIQSSAEWLMYPAWSPDGNTIAFARHRVKEKARNRYVSIESVSVDGGPTRSLFDERLGNCFRIAWTSGGDGIVFGGTKLGEHMTSRRDQVWHSSLATGKITRITPEGGRYVFEGLTDENAAIVFSVNRPSQIWEIDANGDSRTAIQLTTGSTDGRTGIAPLPDGRVGYLKRNGDNWEIWTINGDGSGQTQIFNENPIIDELRATPDGKYFVFNAEVNGNYQLFRLNTDGSDLKQLTFGDDVFVGDASPSSDSRSVVHSWVDYTQEPPSGSLSRVPIDGGEPLPLEGITVGAGTPHHSPDGKYMSYIDTSVNPSRLAVLRADDATVRFYDAVDSGLLNVGAIWTPDSRSLAYIAFNGKAANVWIQPIDGGPPRQFTDFTAGRIYRIAFSSDGKRLYLARGYAVNDAILIKGFTD